MTGETIIYFVDDRSSFLRDEHYPNLILLYTFLRWTVTGNVIGDHDAEQIIKNNNKALASIAALLADKIESGVIPIFSVHTLQPIGTAEMNPILSRLRSMDGSNNVEGLADEDGRDYYLGGWQLVKEFVGSVANINDDQKGGVWKMLMRDTPAKWRTAQTTNELGPVEAMPVMLTEEPKPWEIVDPRDPAPKYPWYTSARHFARQLVIDDSTLLSKPHILADKVVKSLTKVDIYKRGGKKPFNASTILKAFSNLTLG